MPVLQQQSYNVTKAITPSDTVNFSLVADRATCDAIYVGGAGVVVAVKQDGTTDNFTAVAGEILPVKAKRVNNTTTTATLMVALYCV